MFTIRISLLLVDTALQASQFAWFFYTAWLLLLTEMYVLYGQLQIVKLIHLG